MSSHRMARQSSAADLVSLPDVGRMTQQEFRQLEANLYGRRSTRPGTGTPTNASASASSSNARPPPGMAFMMDPLPVEHWRGASARSGPEPASLSFARFPVSMNRRSAAPEARLGPGTPSTLDFASGQMSELELLQTLELGGLARTSAPSRFRAVAHNTPQPSGGTGNTLPGDRQPAAPRSHTAQPARPALDTPSEDQMVYIPDVGRISRQQLHRLGAVLDGRADDGTDLSDLPDLSGLDSNQLARIEAALRGNTTAEPLVHAGNDRRPQLSQGSPAQVLLRQNRLLRESQERGPESQAQSLERPTPTRQGAVPAHGIVTFLGPAPRNDTGTGPARTDRWNVKDDAFNKLSISMADVPADQECAICFQALEAAAVALPCADHSCASFFHRGCIRPWLEQNPTCPLCRCNLEELVTPLAPSCRGCGDASASVEAMLTAMGLAELMGQQHALTYLLRQGTDHWRRIDVDADVIAADPTDLLVEALLQDRWTAADFAADFTPAQNARARLEGADLGGVLGAGSSTGQWRSAADLLGFASDPDVAERLPRDARRDLHGNAAAQRQQAGIAAENLQRGGSSMDSQGDLLASETGRSVPPMSSHMSTSQRVVRQEPAQREVPPRSTQLSGAVRQALLPVGGDDRSENPVSTGSEASRVRSTAAQRTESPARMPPPGRFFASGSAASQSSTVTQSVLQRSRQSDVALRLPPAINFAETASTSIRVPRNRQSSLTSGGGWRPPSRGSTQAQAQSPSASNVSRSASVPQLGRLTASTHRL